MKGIQTLFSQLITTSPGAAAARTPGRNASLIAQRDERLVHRHYYYLSIRKKRYDEIISLLSTEFDLSGTTIIERLQLEKNFQLLKHLHSSKPGITTLRKRYSWMVWK